MPMDHRSNNRKECVSCSAVDGRLDLDALLHPARAFAHPMDVVRDIDLTLNEKRAILASWASDACAVEAAPELRATAPGKVVRWDDIMDALRMLDRQDTLGRPLPHYKRVLERKGQRLLRPRSRRDKPDDEGRALG
jgi:hypothetical protein